ncbi:zonular occludens toxin [Pseudomonas stutzeri]|uniref:zonular occludens toxin domain-containing protein n=1 Tax=Stutzerimonas stutzeri TaxID=316 RepID=UPI00190D7963|nr:zonular occludens toxin domain-containing protein [Stutzerimonas stutzeri]MBK3866677.1 zonular occludens toxin [Stutzerimonas stutzeri]
MLVIRTGKPGHGKTLNTIREVDQKAHAEGRVVYYHNINGLKPEQLQAQWFEFEDPEKWFELPSDSIIVVDEAQGWFGAKDPRARPPEHITRFETMRHQGHEVHLVTQDPRYLAVHLRRLCNSHIHYWRVFKSSQLLRFESEVVVEKVEVKTSFKDAEKKSLRLDKRYFGAYTSTNAKHHFQTKVPTKFILALCVIIVAAILVYRAYGRFGVEKQQAAMAQASAEQAGSVVDQVKSSVDAFMRPGDKPDQQAAPMTAERYAALRTPRIPDIPSSAPIYDELTKPQTYPKLSCVMSSDQGYIERNRNRYRVIRAGGKGYMCECYSQQGTWHKTSFSFCKNAVEHGYFDPARPDPKPPQAPIQTNAGQPPEFEQAISGALETAPKGSSVVVVPHEKGRFLW